MPRTRAFERAFTLIELLVVIAIIATLAAVVAPAVFHHVSDAKTEAALFRRNAFLRDGDLDALNGAIGHLNA